MINFKYIKQTKLPPLAWLAIFTKDFDTVEVICGDAVVTSPIYFVAGVWDGDFQKGEFDTCTTPCCTGMKIKEIPNCEEVNLITPAHLQETVFSIRVDDKIYLSNSLTFVLEVSGSELLTTYKQYVADMGSILYGLKSDKLVKRSPLVAGRELRYLRCCIATIDKSLNIKESIRKSGLTFNNFLDYKQKVQKILADIKMNATDALRKHPYGMISTISRGYDAPSACVFAASVGCDEVFTFCDKPYDNGSQIAKILGYKKIHRVDSKQYIKNSKYLEAEALASGEGGATFIAFEELFRDKLLIIGNRGDSVYERLHVNANNDLDFHVGNQLSQSSLTIYENMLKNNSITISIPLIGGDCWLDMKRISESEEMKPFSVGDYYDRPIARRLLEEAGVNREMFGQKKFGAGISYSLDSFSRIRSKMSVHSFESLIDFKKSFPGKKWNDIKYKVAFCWINRSIYINYILGKMHIRYSFKNASDRTGMMANPYSTMMLHWGISIMKNRYKM